MQLLAVDLFRSNINFKIAKYTELVSLNAALKDEMGRYSYISDSKKCLSPLGVLLNNIKVLNSYLKDILKLIEVPKSILNELSEIVAPLNFATEILKLKGCNFKNKVTAEMENIGVNQNNYNLILKWIDSKAPNSSIKLNLLHRNETSVFLMERHLSILLNALVILKNESGSIFGCFL